jgi:hypothetical protein
MTDAVELVRELYRAAAAGDRPAIAVRMAPEVQWQGRERGPWWRRGRLSCAGAANATASMLAIGRKLPTIQPRAFQRADDRVMVGLWADTMEGRPARWWSVLTIRDGQVTAIADHARQRDALRTLAPNVETSL